LLIHWPNAEIPLAETIGALNKAKRDGLTKHIGVSNFNVALIEEATRLSEAPLVCDQVEYHPFLDQSKVIAACGKHDMAVVAYSPIARGGAEGDKVLGRIAKARGKSPAQISLRWLVQQGVVVIPRTSKAERLKENIALFDFELTAAEMKEVAGLARGGRIVNWAYAPKWD
jgi:diketogulonate reductase-like aldo/keto reductase